ncbi:MAG: cupin domain-containing protein [Actinomycetota bacterium]|nr:cupin domain-containing protein [Actinomycetota bacterium]
MTASTTGGGRAPAGYRPALLRCAGAATDGFAEDHWGRRPLLCAADKAAFQDLFSLDAVDELVSRRGLRTPFIRVVKDGSAIEPARYTRSGGAGAEIADQVAADKLLALVLDGATIVLQGLHRVWPPLTAFADQLAEDLGHPVQVNAYITPPQSQGFSAHYDVHDVFVLQIAGRKRWLVHEPVHPLPLRTQQWKAGRADVDQAVEGPPTIDTVLRPGDAMYLPRGYLHSAVALGDVCAHLTVGVPAVTRYAIVEALCALAADEPALRESLPLGFDAGDPAALANDLAETVRVLVKRIEAATPDDVVAGVRDRVWSAGRAAPIAPLAQAAAVARLDGDSVVRLRRHLRHRLRVAGDRIVLELPDRTLSLPAAIRPALETLLADEPVRVADLPAMEAGENLVLVRRLLREAVVVPAG